MAYAILRFDKIKTLPDLTSMASHWDRSRPTPNADPRAQHWAVQFLHGQDGVSEVEKRLPAKRRKDAVLGLEGLLSASPEYFRDDPAQAGVFDLDRTKAWVKASMTWLKKEYGDRLASAVVHLDEATPHIHAAIVPLDRKTGRLDAKTQFNRAELRRFQTDYAKALKPLGIRRGQENSQARHEDVQRYYGSVNAALEPPELTLADRDALAMGRLPETIKLLQAQAADGRQARREATKAKAEARRQAEARTAAEQAIAGAREAEKAMANRLREIPLTTVLPRLAYLRTRKDQDVEWDGPAGPLTTGANDGKPTKFYLAEMEKGGRGVTDLVMQVNRVDYAGALSWLSRFVKEEELIADAAAQARARAQDAVEESHSRPPEPVLALSHDPDDFAQVREKLKNSGLLTEVRTDSLRRLGLIDAARFGRRSHMVFPLFEGDRADPSQQPVGYIVEDLTRLKARQHLFGAPGVWRCSRSWDFEGADREVRVLTHSPTEALALLQVVEQRQGIFPQLEDQKIRRISFQAVDFLAAAQLAPLVNRAKADRATLMLGLQDDDRGRGLTQAFGQEAQQQGVPASSLTSVLRWAGVQSFMQLWLQIIQQGADQVRQQIESARAARAKRQQETEAARRAGGRGVGD